MPKDIRHLSTRRKNQLAKASFEHYTGKIVDNPENCDVSSVPTDSHDLSLHNPPSENLHVSLDSTTISELVDEASLDASLAIQQAADDGEDNLEYVQQKDFKNDLRQWVQTSHVPRRKVGGLLDILRNHGHSDELPKDVRTLMETPTNSCRNIQRGNGGEYMHFGLEIGLKRSIEKYFKDCPDTIYFQLNVDGVSLSKSSSSKFWPVLAAIRTDFYTTPVLVGLYHGAKDPADANVYLEPFVEEMKNIEINGIQVGENNVRVILQAFICDAPAKSFILKVKGHSGYSSCTKCIQEGDWNRCVVFPEIDNPLRTDRAFRAMEDGEYHHSESILVRLDIDMVLHFALDYMHLVCLGVMKRLIQLWVKGPKDLRLRADLIKRASDDLVATGHSISSEFARLARELAVIDKWKATECRQFLLYTGPVILKSILTDDYYTHFLALSVAIRILSDSYLNDNFNDYADSLLRWFVTQYKVLYGIGYISHNVHNLVHLADEAKRFGCLDQFNCFKFENYMIDIKSKVQNCPKPLAQVVNRTLEEYAQPVVPEYVKSYPIVKECRSKITELHYEYFRITTKRKDNTCLLSDSSILIVREIFKRNDELYFRGDRITNTKSLFNKPCDSKDFNCCVIDHNSTKELITI